MMSKRKAWLYLSKLWGATNAPHVMIDFGHRKVHCIGLCDGVNILLETGQITRDVYRAMHKEITAAIRSNCGDLSVPLGFGWTRDVTGARQRAAFCRKMAAKLKPKKKARAKK